MFEGAHQNTDENFVSMIGPESPVLVTIACYLDTILLFTPRSFYELKERLPEM